MVRPRGPRWEVDLALPNRARLIGQGTIFLGLAEEDANKSPFIATSSTGRIAGWFEQANGDFGQTIHGSFILGPGNICLPAACNLIARTAIASDCAKGVKEVAYHRELAADWTIRLGDGTEDERGGRRPKPSTGAGDLSRNCSKSTSC
jgi:ring-1,2-phenylacetyl-CoA epoxidase subunit PaaC